MNIKDLNELLRQITLATRQGDLKYFKYECDNCVLTIATCKNHKSTELEAVDISIKNKDDSYFEMPSGFYGSRKEYDITASFLYNVPIVGIPLVLKAFSHAPADEMQEIFDSFDFICNCCFHE